MPLTNNKVGMLSNAAPFLTYSLNQQESVSAKANLLRNSNL